MKQRYKEKIGYLYPRKAKIKSASDDFSDSGTHEVEGQPFYCNVREQPRRIENPMSNMYRTVTETVLLTDSELEFNEHDRITFKLNPQNDVNNEDFSAIVSAIKKPRYSKGSKYRTRDLYTWEIRIS